MQNIGFLTAVLFALFYEDVECHQLKYRMCVPHVHYDACVKLVNAQTSNLAQLECVSARDRLDCLQVVNEREADFVIADPEDMYVAANLNNEDFLVFAQIRTVEEPEADYRYQGIMLVRKDSNIRSLSDLKGKKSCHTGYGRTVGYKIPVMKLKKHGILQVSDDATLTPVERELAALSNLFSRSCLVGNYSPNSDINRTFKKHYSNLCALCEDPIKCNYPDKYSGYDGAIKCLVEAGGDVAFTKVIFVRRFFALPVNGVVASAPAQANPNDYEYLCEDGSRRPLTGNDTCSWAQRPWAGYIGNGDMRKRVIRLQERLQEFYNASKTASDKQSAIGLGVYDKYVLVNRIDDITPAEHLNNAQYTDVIERDGNTHQEIRLCVLNDSEKTRCESLSIAAYAREVRPGIVCIISSDCIQSVADNTSDVTIVSVNDQLRAKDAQLNRVLEEAFDFNYIAVAGPNLPSDLLLKVAIQYDPKDAKTRDVALKLNKARNTKRCQDITVNPAPIRIIRSDVFNSTKRNADDDHVICPDLSPMPLSTPLESLCKFDVPTRGVFVRKSLFGHELDAILHAFTLISNKFGAHGPLSDVFELFGGSSDVLVSRDACSFVSPSNDADRIASDYANLSCV